MLEHITVLPSELSDCGTQLSRFVFPLGRFSEPDPRSCVAFGCVVSVWRRSFHSNKACFIKYRSDWQADNLSTMSGHAEKFSAEVVLGFLEEAERWRLLSPQFPSKVGGKPAWLSLRGLPEVPQLECEMCRLPLVFLLQVSVPRGRPGGPPP